MQNHISHFRRNAGMSQRDLARAMDVASPRISEWETGKTIPRVDTALALARILRCTLDDLFPVDSSH